MFFCFFVFHFLSSFDVILNILGKTADFNILSKNIKTTDYS